jgi:HK97 family phage prohead protease
MAKPALKRMANIINTKSVPLRVEHQQGDGAIIGSVNEAWLDDRNNLWIKAPLEKGNPAATMLHNALKAGAKLGLSVGGRVKRAVRELAEGIGKEVRTFYDVDLNEVSVTPRPSNFDAWLLAKHYKTEEEDTFKFYDSPIYETYLSENPKLNYLLAFEKSIPIDCWKKVESNTNNLNEMKKENDEMVTSPAATETIEEKEETIVPEESTTKYASMGYVDKKFNELTNLIKSGFQKMTEIDATSTTRETSPEATPDETPVVVETNPTETANENPAQMRVVATVGKNKNVKKDGANGTTADTREATGTETVMTEATEALESSNPVESIESNSAQPFAEGSTSKSRFITSLMTKVKKAVDDYMTSSNEASETKKETEEYEPSSEQEEATKETESINNPFEEEKEDEESHSTSDYDIADLQRAMKSRGISDMDAFVGYISSVVSEMRDGFAKSGKRVVGLERMVSDMICNDQEIQKSIREWLKKPGLKKSVVVGSPYVFMKDGTRMKLISDSATVQKSVQAGATFGDTYKQNYSSEVLGR